MGLFDNSRGAFYKDILEAYEISTTQGALLFSVPSFVALIVSLLSFKWLRSLGVLKAQLISLSLFFLSCLSLATFKSFSDSYLLMIAFHGILWGSGLGIFGITGNLLVGKGTLDHNRQRYLSLYHAIYALASASAPLIIAYLSKSSVNWQSYLFYCSFVFLIPLGYSSVQFMKGVKVQESSGPIGLPSLFQCGIGMMFGLYVSSEVLLTSRLVYYLEIIHGMAKGEASYYLGAFFILFFIFRSLPFWVKISFPTRISLMTSNILTIFFLILGTFYHPIFFPLCAISLSIYFPFAMNWVLEREDSEQLVPTAMCFVGGNLILAHLMFGVVANISLQWSMIMIVLMQFIVFLLTRFYILR